MLHSKAGEHLQAAIIHRNWNVEDEFPIRVSQHLPQPFVQVKFLSCEIEAGGLRLPGINFLFQRNSLHRISDGVAKRLDTDEPKNPSRQIGVYGWAISAGKGT